MKLMLLGILLLVPGALGLLCLLHEAAIHTLSIWPRASCNYALRQRETLD